MKYVIDTKIKVFGEIDEENKIIRINPKRGDVVNTIIHEELHAKFPNLTEKEIRKKAEKIESKMTLKQMANLLLRIHRRAKKK
jgi:hypothetical protein